MKRLYFFFCWIGRRCIWHDTVVWIGPRLAWRLAGIVAEAKR